jgi:hypothetical protein
MDFNFKLLYFQKEKYFGSRVNYTYARQKDN